MNDQLYSICQLQINPETSSGKRALEEQVTALIQWKREAKVQLQYFMLACTLYNFCDTGKINELLHQD